MKFFDTHAHIGLIHNDPIEELIVIQQAKQAGVEHIVSICNSLHDFDEVYQNLKTATNIYHAVGISPSEVVHQGRNWESRIIENVKLDRVVAIGEIGLDYYRKFSSSTSLSLSTTGTQGPTCLAFLTTGFRQREGCSTASLKAMNTQRKP